MHRLGQFLRYHMSGSGIPGLAVGIVEGSDVLWARGYGVADLRRRIPVTAETRFGIGSCTKAFTAAAIALLVEEGRLKWDEPLCKIVPGFRLHDDVASRCASIRDLLLHRTGVPAHDLAVMTSPEPRAALLSRIPHLQASAGFRTAFQYSNLMYAVAGAVLEHVAGTSWERFVRNRIFTPLGMRHTGFSSERQDPKRDVVGHAARLGGTVPWLQGWGCGNNLCAAVGQAYHPAGGIRASAYDLCRWLLANLNQGQLDGQRVLPAAQLLELHRPGIVIPPILNEPELLDASYAMGWICQPYRGNRCFYHWGGGGADGNTSFLSFMPDRKLGLAVVMNIEAPPLVPAVMAFTIYDRLLGVEAVGWARRWRKIIRRMKADFMAQQEAANQPAGRVPKRIATALAGDYYHPGYGRIHIRRSAGGLELQFNSLRFTMRDCGDGAFDLTPRVPLSWWGRRQARCQWSRGGKLQSLEVLFEPAIPNLAFRRRTR
ncbi:MAG: serine hydrolase [Anaerolineae bacterium]|nr:serine hydrolase [Anaerolineae bacterium]